MNVSLPYTECYVKRSFLMGPKSFNWGKDEMIPAVLLSFKAVMGEAPLFEVYLPEYQACYDKVLQCAIFDRQIIGPTRIDLDDVAYWDCLSDDAELHIKPLRMHMRMKNPNGVIMTGDYLWTIDWRRCNVPGTQWNVWNEHKQKNFFFDEKTGVLCCGPNNRIHWFDKSLSHQPPKAPFFKVFEKTWSHENELALGKATKWNYDEDT